MTNRQALRKGPKGRDLNREYPTVQTQHSYGPRANRRALGLTNKATRSLQATTINGEVVRIAQPKALRRGNVAGHGAKLIAHQRRAGFQHLPGEHE